MHPLRTDAEIMRDFDPLALPLGTSVTLVARHMDARNVGVVLMTEGDAKLVGIYG
jgi:hypothetical protein